MKIKLAIAAMCVAFACIPVCALDAKIISVTGKVEIGKDEAWTPAKQGDLLAVGDSISTGFKSEAVVQIGKSTIVVKALSRMTIDQLINQKEGDASSVSLKTGKIRADVKHEQDRRVGFTVKTPALVASVRGTAGEVGVDGVQGEEGRWCICDRDSYRDATADGTYDFAYPNQIGMVYLTPGENTSVDVDGLFEKPGSSAADNSALNFNGAEDDAGDVQPLGTTVTAVIKINN